MMTAGLLVECVVVVVVVVLLSTEDSISNCVTKRVQHGETARFRFL